MKTKRCLSIQFFFVLSIFLLFTTCVQAETTNCTPITTLPYTINTQSVYCLTGNLATSMTSGCAITINVNNVTLDLNDFKIGGLAAGLNTDAVGVCANCRQNITVRNGTIRGFLVGVDLLGSQVNCAQGYVVENIRADSNTYHGITVGGNGSVVRNNLVISTGGTTRYPSLISCGIDVDTFATNVIVVNNDVINTFNTSSPIAAEGICLNDAGGCMVINNRVSGAHIGISLGNTTGLYRGNTVANIDPNGGSAYWGGTNAGENYP